MFTTRQVSMFGLNLTPAAWQGDLLLRRRDFVLAAVDENAQKRELLSGKVPRCGLSCCRAVYLNA